MSITLQEMNYRNLCGGQIKVRTAGDIWEATYSPMDKEGYPVRIWDKVTGEIDSTFANHWKENI
ncbi:MAG: hypothetical protein IPO37_07170 [Saprospiraceae bacterium]|nr:hypothetical protein [Saprospiraceae bacterium]